MAPPEPRPPKPRRTIKKEPKDDDHEDDGGAGGGGKKGGKGTRAPVLPRLLDPFDTELDAFEGTGDPFSSGAKPPNALLVAQYFW